MLNVVFLALRITINRLLVSILESTNGDGNSETLLDTQKTGPVPTIPVGIIIICIMIHNHDP